MDSQARPNFSQPSKQLSPRCTVRFGREEERCLPFRPPWPVLPPNMKRWKKLSVLASTSLSPNAHSNSPLQVAPRAADLFQDTRARLPEAARDALNSLEGMCTQRRQMDEQARIHFWLHNWLWVHFPLSIALILLMFVHVFTALKYM